MGRFEYGLGIFFGGLIATLFIPMPFSMIGVCFVFFGVGLMLDLDQDSEGSP